MHCYSCRFPIWPCSEPYLDPHGSDRKRRCLGKQFRTRKWHRRGEMAAREARLGRGKRTGRFQARPTVWFSLTGPVQVSAADDSHLSFLRPGCRRHHMCYQQRAHIPIMVGTHSLLAWHQSTTQLSICRWSDKQKWLGETGRQREVYLWKLLRWAARRVTINLNWALRHNDRVWIATILKVKRRRENRLGHIH